MNQNKYGWRIDIRFSLRQVSLIQGAGNDLEAYLDPLMGGFGWEWIMRHTRGARVHRGGLLTKVAACVNKLPTSLVLPYSDIWLWEDFDRFRLPKRHFLHELGHVVENRLPKSFLSPPTIFGGGASDRLTRYLGGKPAGLRFANGTSGIPEHFHWHGTGIYGNHATADYFAEAFSWLPYDLSVLPHAIISDWFNREIFSI